MTPDVKRNASAQHGDRFVDGVIACLPTILGYWSIGFAAGAIGSLAGFPIGTIALLAGLLYAGSAQFLYYSLAAAGAGPIAIVLGVLLINIRYLLMSSSLSSYFGGKRAIEKFVGGALLTDETFGVASQYAKAHGVLPLRWLLGLNLTAYVNWIVANLLGAWLADALPPRLTEGLGFSLTAMFIGLLVTGYFGSRQKVFECTAMGTAMIVVLASKAWLDINAAILAATVLAALVAASLSGRTSTEGNRS